MGYKSDLSKVMRTTESVNFPDVVVIDNVNACNLKCSICDHKNIRKHRKIQTMNMELYEKIVHEIGREKPGARVWQIFFGEPFLCKNMTQRIEYAKRMGLEDVVLNTNGVLMTQEKSETVIKAGLDALYVGIDATSEDVYAKIRVGGDFQKVVNNVLVYRDLLEKYGHDDQQLYVQFIVTDINESEADAFLDFWNEHGVNVKVRPKVSWAGLVKAGNLISNQIVERKPCYWLMRTMVICADGRIPLCGTDVHCRTICGNAEENSLKELWNGQLKSFRKMHKNGHFDELPEMCRSCSDWQSTYTDYVLPKSVDANG